MKMKIELEIRIDQLSTEAKRDLFVVLEKHEIPSRLLRFWGIWEEGFGTPLFYAHRLNRTWWPKIFGDDER